MAPSQDYGTPSVLSVILRANFSAEASLATIRAPYRVIFGDTDALGIVYHANYLRIMDMARVEWFRKFSLPPRVLYEEYEYLIVVIQAHLEFKQPARFDDLLTVETWLSEKWVRSASIRFEYRLWHENGDLCARGYTRHAFTNRSGLIKRPSRDYVTTLRGLAENRGFDDDA